MLVWLMPVSNQRGVLNSILNNCMYIFFIITIFLMVLYDVWNKKTININSTKISIFCIFLLIFFSICTAQINPGISFGWKEFATFVALFMVIGYRFSYITPNKTWRTIFYIVSTVIAVCGILMLIGNSDVWDFFSTYYVNHYSYVYEEFRKVKKPVTFFAANSTTPPVYFMIYFLWELCESKRHKLLSIIYRIIYIILLIGCFSNSSILCIGLIILYYLFSSAGGLTKKKLIINTGIVVFTMIIIMYNLRYLQSIIFSKANGLLGRYSASAAGNVLVNIYYILGMNIPIGCMLVDGLYITDSGVIVYILRGSLLLMLGIYYLLYSSLIYYTKDKFTAKYIFICILCFEIAYPILIAQRFMPFLCFFFLYVNSFYNKNEYIKL